jgi:hypothetical protein
LACDPIVWAWALFYDIFIHPKRREIGMPGIAIQSGCVDSVLPLEEIGGELARIEIKGGTKSG